MAGKKDSWNGWRERISALRNVPAVLRIVWDSGRTVVVLGVCFSLADFSSAPRPPVDYKADHRHTCACPHHPSSRSALACGGWLRRSFRWPYFGSVLTRGVDFLDALLADKYTRHVSMLVMKHAAQLDLMAYEDPVFYDRLERARVQATDRLGMIQSIGRLVQQVITTISLSVAIMLFSPWLLLMLVAVCGSGISGRESFCLSGLRQEFPPDSHSPSTGLLARGGRQQRSGQGTQALRAAPLSDRTVHSAFGPDLRRGCRAWRAAG